MPPIFNQPWPKKYVRAFFFTDLAFRKIGLPPTWTNGLRMDYPYRATFDGVLAELKKQQRKMRKKKK